MKTIKEFIEHPAEGIFDLTPGTTVSVREESDTIAEIPKDDSYDEKDQEIEIKTQEIYDAAITAFKQQTEMAALAEPKYASRSMEVGAIFLNTALAAIKQRADVKQHKEKQRVSVVGPNGTLNQTNIYMSRNEMLEQLINQNKGQSSQVIDGSATDETK